MSEMPSIADHFANMLSVDAAAMETGRHAILDLGSGRRVGIEQTPTDLLVYVSQTRQYDAPRYFLSALKHAHYARKAQWPVQVAVQDHSGEPRVLALMRLERAGLNTSRLDKAAAFLWAWLDSLDDD